MNTSEKCIMRCNDKKCEVCFHWKIFGGKKHFNPAGVELKLCEELNILTTATTPCQAPITSFKYYENKG